ncbi:MAG: sensor histidine kinase [Chloroflexi bacterium]|nr:sensor histidine kinase [Chloroflexota bacterium]
MGEFFQLNREIVFFIYGQAFFVLGLAVALQSFKHSEIALARHLGLLALFGIVHGVYEWGAVFIPIQRAYLSPDGINALRLVRLLLEAISFFALFQFGVALSMPSARAAPLGLFTLWALVGAGALIVAPMDWTESFDLGDILARYLLGVPGAFAAAWGLNLQARQAQRMNLARIARYFRGAAFAFAGYGFLCAITPRANFFPASVLNYDLFNQNLGVSAAVFRALCGISIAYLIIRGLEIFSVETEHQLEEAAQTRAVSADRERIGRELHDGIIQALYGAGLMLEDAALSLDGHAPPAKEKINHVIGMLNQTIRDLRSYILDLRRETGATDCAADLGELARAFRLQTLVDAELRVIGTRRDELTTAQKKEMLAIAREALINVAKHARATRVNITLTYLPDAVELQIADNGVGWQTKPSPAPGQGQGLTNMRERAELIGAQLAIQAEPNQGTIVRVTAPLTRQKEQDGAANSTR